MNIVRQNVEHDIATHLASRLIISAH